MLYPNELRAHYLNHCLGNTRQWKMHTFHLPDAYFGDRQAYGSDFRLSDSFDGQNFFGRVSVYKFNPDISPKPPPTARFFSIRGNGGSLTLEFIDSSTGGKIDSWLWDFGDSSTSDQRNPSHTYAVSGEYMVSLTVSGPGVLCSCASTAMARAREHA